MTLWENVFAVLVLVVIVPAIWMSQSHAYLVLQKTAVMQQIEAVETRLMEDVTHGSSIPQAVQEENQAYQILVAQAPDVGSTACVDQKITVVLQGRAVRTLVLPSCTRSIFSP
ncbi:hypothetical protein SAMN05421799_10294 [Alicyclobacillus vulcanalis]|uniref:Uncharacterized protein n=1 Tax=Alicyclobacillus vulcanalis TaxID=252246 RepID=A0A1N7KPF7_9BACL|nr:hypothetical protein SAMN05421799_10294 [Alicyclobacillus vulcanalis]